MWLNGGVDGLGRERIRQGGCLRGVTYPHVFCSVEKVAVLVSVTYDDELQGILVVRSNIYKKIIFFCFL